MIWLEKNNSSNIRSQTNNEVGYAYFFGLLQVSLHNQVYKLSRILLRTQILLLKILKLEIDVLMIVSGKVPPFQLFLHLFTSFNLLFIISFTLSRQVFLLNGSILAHLDSHQLHFFTLKGIIILKDMLHHIKPIQEFISNNSSVKFWNVKFWIES